MKAWQQQAQDTWVYGEKVRGIIRQQLACVAWRPGLASGFGGTWHWLTVLPEGKEECGRAMTLVAAVEYAEGRLKDAGLLEDDVPRGTSP